MEIFHFEINGFQLLLSGGTLPAWSGKPKAPVVYDETYHLRLSGKVCHPSPIAGREVMLSVYGDHSLQAHLAQKIDKRSEHKGIGYVDFWGRNNTACIWVSVDMFCCLRQLVDALPVHFILMGDEMKRRSAPIRHFQVETDFNQDDWY